MLVFKNLYESIWLLGVVGNVDKCKGFLGGELMIVIDFDCEDYVCYVLWFYDKVFGYEIGYLVDLWFEMFFKLEEMWVDNMVIVEQMWDVQKEYFELGDEINFKYKDYLMKIEEVFGFNFEYYMRDFKGYKEWFFDVVKVICVFVNENLNFFNILVFGQVLVLGVGFGQGKR